MLRTNYRSLRCVYKLVFKNRVLRKSSILWWKKKFLETGSIVHKKRSSRLCTSDVDVESVRETFLFNPRRSVATELNMPFSAVYKAIKKRLRLHTYKVQIVQALKPEDRPKRMVFATDITKEVGR
ncbi:DUF4817 domain-containing protein [Nephila pilipes]|uniref:DUF4817 domain-containing protein n=1 Tax=Nephila pilipes TaxID=299642 RepID=A0A8X6UIT6_NEPPI|nr:DUF4817 domain-containing protein [Nephila pilipes]